MGLKCGQQIQNNDEENAKLWRNQVLRSTALGVFVCLSESRYTDKLPPATFFVRFPNPGKVEESMTDLEKKKEMEKNAESKKFIKKWLLRGFFPN